MTPRYLLRLTILGAMLLGFAQTASAQSPTEGDEIQPIPLPADWRDRSGIEVGMEIKAIAELEGTPFDKSMIDPRERPAIGLEVVQRGRNILVLEDNDGAIRSASFAGQRAWQSILQTVYTLYPDRFDMVMALTEWQERSAFAYYLPLANDTRGIGYLHLSGRDVFNQTGSNLDGLIFMNDYRTYLGRNAVFGRIVFLQEIGHRWGSFVYYGNGPSNGRDMLGRDESHWSYFMSTGNSALEGNDWNDNGNSSYTTQTNAFRFGFSQLDLYLMGFLPANEVDDWFLIRDPDVRGQRDDFGRTLNAASGPAINGRATVSGTRYNISIDDVITAEGARNPSFAASQKTWNVATVLILNQGSTWSARSQETVEELIDSWEVMFEEETGGAADLVFTLEDNPQPPQADYGEECTSTAQCNTENSTVCLTTDDGQICSRRCAQASECGAGFCCAEDFCYPTGDSMCEMIDPGPGMDPNPDAGPDQEVEPDPCNSGFVSEDCECVGFGCPDTGANITPVDPDCACQSPNRPAPRTPIALGLAAALLGGLLLRRR